MVALLNPLRQFGVDWSLQESCQVVLFNATQVDGAVTALGTNQATAYPVTCGATLVSSAAAGTGLVLPPTSSAVGQGGASLALQLWIAVASGVTNFVTVYPSANDSGATINGQSSVVLGAATVTPFQCFNSGVWLADSIGTGAAGSLETIVSQGTLAATGSTRADAAAITQAMVNVTSDSTA